MIPKNVCSFLSMSRNKKEKLRKKINYGVHGSDIRWKICYSVVLRQRPANILPLSYEMFVFVESQTLINLPYQVHQQANFTRAFN